MIFDFSPSDIDIIFIIKALERITAIGLTLILGIFTMVLITQIRLLNRFLHTQIAGVWLWSAVIILVVLLIGAGAYFMQLVFPFV